MESQMAEIQVELDRLKLCENNVSLHNISSISNNQATVYELEAKISQLETQNELLKASNEDRIVQRVHQLE